MNSDSETTNGTPVRQFSVMLENRVGAFASMIKLLRTAHVEVLGLSLADSIDVSLARMVVSDPDATLQCFLEKGIPHVVNDVVVVALPQGAASLGACLSALLEGETNIHFSYSLLVQGSDHPLLVLHLEDADIGGTILHDNGFKTLCQEDLSR